jgi:hypothetical protein
MADLSLELLTCILSNLKDPRCLTRAGAVCRNWRDAGRDERLWMWLFMTARTVLPRPAAMPSSWRREMLERLRVGANLAQRRFVATRLVGHR